jgi:hypothetical protein
VCLQARFIEYNKKDFELGVTLNHIYRIPSLQFGCLTVLYRCFFACKVCNILVLTCFILEHVFWDVWYIGSKILEQPAAGISILYLKDGNSMFLLHVCTKL